MPDPKENKLYAGEKLQANPFPFAYTLVRDPQTGETVYRRTVSPQIPDRILVTGNRKELEDFYTQNRRMLTAADKRYMQARIHTAAAVDHLEKKALQDLAQGKRPPQPNLTTKKGYIGFDKLKLSGPQTSGNGCWSCAMSLLLKSRGVDMSQEEIRAFRPDYEAGRENMGEDRRISTNRDTSNSPYENGDLVMKVLPNTAVRNFSLNPVDEEMVLTGEAQLPDPPPGLNEVQQSQWLIETSDRLARERRDRAAELYKKQAKALFMQKVKQGLIEDKSPVILNRGDSHYVTITGISEDGKKLRIEDSVKSGSGTKYVKVDEMIDKYLAPGMHGLDLTWIHDLPVPEKKPEPEKKAEPEKEPAQEKEPLQEENPAQEKEPAQEKKTAPEKVSLLPDMEGAATVDQSGEVILEETGDFVTAQRAPKERLGQLKGQELNNTLYMDQTELQQELGGNLVGHGEDENGRALQMIGTENTYLPRKVRLLKDPAIEEELKQKEAQEQQEEEREKQELLASVGEMDKPEYLVVGDDDVKEEPAAGTFDAFLAARKEQLYQQGPDTAAYIAELYAMNVVRSSREKREADRAADEKAEEAMRLVDELDKLKNAAGAPDEIKKGHGQLVGKYPHLQAYVDEKSGLLRLNRDQLREQIKAGNRTEKQKISPVQQKMIEEMSKLALPVVKDMLGSQKESTALPLVAVEEDQRKLVDRISSFAQKQYYIEPNPNNDPKKPDWTEIKKVIDSSVTVLRSTGTGKNFFGSTRARNSDKYERMLSSLTQYQNLLAKGITPSGMQNRDLTQKLLDYAGDKYSVRSTKDTGQVRFDSVMRVIRQVMPPKQFKQLLKQINQKREAKPGDKHYVDENTYAPKTAGLCARMKVQQAINQSGSSYIKLCSEALAAKLIGQTGQRGDKTLVEDPADPSLKQALEEKAALLRQDPNFHAALKNIPTGDTAEQTRRNRRDWLSNGDGLVNLYNSAKETVLAQQV